MAEFFNADELRLLPSNALEGIKKTSVLSLQNDMLRAKSVRRRMDELSGKERSSLGRMGGSVLAPSTTGLKGAFSAIKGAAGVALGAAGAVNSLLKEGQSAYSNLSNPSQAKVTSLNSKLSNELSNIAPDEDLISAEKKADLESLGTKLGDLQDSINTKKSNMTLIEDIVRRRAEGKEIEPIVNYSSLGTGDGTSPEFLEMIGRTVMAPLSKDASKYLSLTAQVAPLLETSAAPIFDLVYGPPISLRGQFVLSEDGLYYNSRNVEEVPLPSGTPLSTDRTNFEYAPNLGGRGEVYEEKDANIFAGTIFDLDIITENRTLLPFYRADNVLQQFIADKEKQVFDVSGQITELIAGGQETSGALVTNHNLNLAAISSNYDLKIKKRKKQLELAYLSNRFRLGQDTVIYNNPETGQDETIENIPLNDFSFLKGTGLAPSVTEQASLTLSLGDVQDSVLPIAPIFLHTVPDSGAGRVFSHLALGKEGTGVGPHWTTTSKLTAFDASGKGFGARSMTDSVTKDGLELGLSFLNPKVVGNSAAEQTSDNFITNGNELDGRLMASATLEMFPSGLSIPFLNGTDLSANGSYVEIPGKDSLYNMFFLKDGFTLSFWVYLPNLDTGTNFDNLHRFRLCMANENTGDGGQTESTRQVAADATILDRKVRGFVIGFRDKGSDKPAFVLYPTVSQNEKNGVWGPSVCFGEDTSGNTLGLVWDDPAVSSVSSGFYNFSIVGNSQKNKVELFFDGSSVATSSMTSVFGMNPATFPTFVTKGDFNLSSYSAPLGTGPTLPNNSTFTTLILGGGFTDTIPTHGFMGRNTNSVYFSQGTSQDAAAGENGAKSGLHGHLGLPLMYSRALNNKEISRNYKLTNSFFKNIKIRD